MREGAVDGVGPAEETTPFGESYNLNDRGGIRQLDQRFDVIQCADLSHLLVIELHPKIACIPLGDDGVHSILSADDLCIIVIGMPDEIELPCQAGQGDELEIPLLIILYINIFPIIFQIRVGDIFLGLLRRQVRRARGKSGEAAH